MTFFPDSEREKSLGLRTYVLSYPTLYYYIVIYNETGEMRNFSRLVHCYNIAFLLYPNLSAAQEAV
jgi:hypothetical protein